MATIEEIHKQIGEECEKIGVDISRLRFKTAIQWFAAMGHMEAGFQLDVAAAELQARTIDQKTFVQRRANIVASTGPVVIRVKGRFPFNSSMAVVAIFGDDAEWRVYTLPIKSDDGSGNHPGPTCYTLGRHAAVFDSEAMSLETFIAEIVDEWATVDSGQGARKIEQDAIVAYLNSLPDDYTVKQAAQDIADEIHLEGDEEEEGETEVVGGGDQQLPNGSQPTEVTPTAANGQTTA